MSKELDLRVEQAIEYGLFERTILQKKLDEGWECIFKNYKPTKRYFRGNDYTICDDVHRKINRKAELKSRIANDWANALASGDFLYADMALNLQEYFIETLYSTYIDPLPCFYWED